MSDQGLQHLNVLSICHYVAGGLLGVYSCLPLFYIGLGISMIVSPQIWSGGGAQPPPPAILGWMFAVLGGASIFVGWSFAICLLIAGYFLARQKHHLFCMIAAGVACMWVPIGTVLGVFTIIVLQRPTVKALFESNRDR